MGGLSTGKRGIDVRGRDLNSPDAETCLSSLWPMLGTFRVNGTENALSLFRTDSSPLGFPGSFYSTPPGSKALSRWARRSDVCLS